MPAFTCPHCQKPFTASTAASATQVLCPHCQKAVEIPATPAPRWFRARDKKKYGPYTWPQLLTLAQRGEVRPDDMLLQEGAKRWVRADTLAALFAKPATAVRAKPPTPANIPTATFAPPSPKSGRRTPWLIAGAAALIGVILAVGVSAAIIYGRKPPPRDPQHVENVDDKKKPPDIEKKPPDVEDPPKKKIVDDPPKKEKKEDKKPTEVSPAAQIEAFVGRLNQHRQAAGVSPVTLDAELSRGCQAHAKYLVQHVDPNQADGNTVYEEDPKKPGYSADGQRAAEVAMVGTLEPVIALERWMGRVPSRGPLLNTEIQTVGVGAARTEQGAWYCVIDPVRGRGEPIVVYPVPKQIDVPIAFTGGPEAPEDTPAGFPISVAFPLAKKVASPAIELRDAKGTRVDGFLWTPEKPPTANTRANVLALVPKAYLHGSSAYQVKASAQLDGKPWSLSWSFTTEDDVDSKGIWAKRALALVNVYRMHAGLTPVTLDAALSDACLKHARYLVLNEGNPALQGLSAHREDPKLPGYTKEGADAGPKSDIAIGDYEPIDAVDAWMGTLYHRVPILAPNLKSIGFGCATGQRQGWATVMNVQSGRDQTPVGPIFYPVPDQKNVPLAFPITGEEPNPIPDDPDRRAGYSITAILPRNTPLQKATGKLTTADGVDVPCWFSAPDRPANVKHADAQGNVACLIAKDPLKPKTTYQVHFQGTLAGKAWEKSWKFTTGDERSVETARREVLERVNHFRAIAGLGAVALDETQTRGCQLHAEYLAKNADILSKRKAPVSDEDPELPGFTAEGRLAARQSQVFTNAPVPVLQIDDLIGASITRQALLDPSLQRVGIGCANDVGRGWRCVFDPNGGRGESRILLYPGPKQVDVPLVGHDRIESAKNPGFPISVIFPRNASVRKAEAVFTDAANKDVDVRISSPEKPLHPTLQRSTIGVHPLEPLRPGQTYSVTVAALVNGKEWRQTWQFTTAR